MTGCGKQFRFKGRLNKPQVYIALFLRSAPVPRACRHMTEYCEIRRESQLVRNLTSAMAEKCIICECSDSKLAQWRNITSWTTLYRAAVIRNHKAIVEASTSESDFPEAPVKYHRNCRVEFTNKRDLQAAKPSQNVETDPPRRNSRDVSQPNSTVLPEQCIFCKKTKYKPNTKTREKLHNVRLYTSNKVLV